MAGLFSAEGQKVVSDGFAFWKWSSAAMNKFYIVLLASSLGVACKHPLDIIGEGDILSASGNRDCYLEWTDPNSPYHANCAENEVLAPDEYVETYYAQPRPGWHFHRWAEPWCAEATTNECSWNIPAHAVAQVAPTVVLKPQLAIFREDVISGYQSLFMGHSLFDPMAVGMADQADEAGYVNHAQETFFFPSASGAPINIWNNPTNKAAVQQVLDEGNVALFGMAIHHDNLGIEGYRLWVDYALKQNPDTRVFIGLPWLWYPHLYADGEDYDAAWHTYHTTVVHGLIDQLREEFPYTDFFCIPYGQAAGELYKLWEAESLPDVETAVSSDPNTPAIWTDLRPHPGQILVDLAELVWLNAIYGVDMTSYPYDPGYITDLKVIADAIAVGHDPDYNAPYLSP